MAKGPTSPTLQQQYSWPRNDADGGFYDRRHVLGNSIKALLLFAVFPAPALAVTENSINDNVVTTTTLAPSKGSLDNRPYAPVEALLPATKQRLLLDQCAQLAKQLVLLDASGKQKGDTTITTITTTTESEEERSLSFHQRREVLVQQLQLYLEKPSDANSYVRGDGSILTIIPRYSIQQAPSFQLGSNRLSGKSVRSAMNIYTSNLQFGESYVLTASPEDRKRMIRNDQLPNVKQVIIANLDLRDLYRNQIQTLVEDAQAELYSTATVDAVELKDLLDGALAAWQRWFDLIAPNDVQSALIALSREESNMAVRSK